MHEASHRREWHGPARLVALKLRTPQILSWHAHRGVARCTINGI
jgi:hypothetical protein